MKRLLPILSCAALLAGCGTTEMTTSALENGVAYEVTLTPMWSAATHPLDYPKAGVLTGPHFSGIIGASHDAGYVLFADGRTPTPGLERLSEEGKHSPLDAEIRSAIGAGTAGELFESGPLKDFAMTASTMVHVSPRFPLVSAAWMIAPSPDWFGGVANVNLREGGQWVATKELTVYAWDSGGDAGTTYEAADADLDPKQPTKLNDAPHFMKNGTRVPVATLTFKRK